jgi:diacylglycerol kinase (CTP)
MTTVEPDTATTAHDTPRRRTARSPSLTRSRAAPIAASKRSPSPIVTFHPTPLSSDHPKGVKNITRKVIKRLEGLGHLEMVEMEEDEQSLSGQDEQVEVEKVLYELGQEALKDAAPANGHANGHSDIAQKAKPDLEIPRKVLHSSIGMSFRLVSFFQHRFDSDPLLICLYQGFLLCICMSRKVT